MARMSWSEALALDQSLLSLNDYFQSPPQIAETLPGGLTNHCWKIVSAKGKAYIWRPNSYQSQMFGISRIREQQLLESLKAYDFTPSPYFLCDKGLLLEWVEGEVSVFPISDIEMISTITKIHSIDIHNKPIALFSYTAKVDSYWLKLESSLKNEEFATLYNLWRNLPKIPPVEQTLCHLDLNQANIIRTSHGLSVIDWEYACVADPRMDLAMAIDLAQLDMPKCVADYCQLRQIEEVDIWLVGVNHWRPRNQLMAMLWYLLGYQLKRDDYYYQQACILKDKLSKSASVN